MERLTGRERYYVLRYWARELREEWRTGGIEVLEQRIKNRTGLSGQAFEDELLQKTGEWEAQRSSVSPSPQVVTTEPEVDESVESIPEIAEEAAQETEGLLAELLKSSEQRILTSVREELNRRDTKLEEELDRIKAEVGLREPILEAPPITPSHPKVSDEIPEPSEAEKRREEVADKVVVLTEEEVLSKARVKDGLLSKAENKLDKVHPDHREEFRHRIEEQRSQSAIDFDVQATLQLLEDINEDTAQTIQQRADKRESTYKQETRDTLQEIVLTVYKNLSPDKAGKYRKQVDDLEWKTWDMYPVEDAAKLIQEMVNDLEDRIAESQIEEHRRDARRSVLQDQKEHYLRVIRTQIDLVPEDRRAEFRQRADILEGEPVETYDSQQYHDLLLEVHRAAVQSERPVPVVPAPPTSQVVAISTFRETNTTALILGGVGGLLFLLALGGTLTWARFILDQGGAYRSVFMGWLIPILYILAFITLVVAMGLVGNNWRRVRRTNP
ncbi:MAG: hypothetical protein ACOX6V_02710 [Patescibacteria group bacterium]|jgi:hypothetical protein